MIERFDIYMAGVGGQGIGLLAEALARAVDYAGETIRGCDTHGLAQRGGIVTSHLRVGTAVHSPLVSPGQADLVIALERHEALRAARDFLKRGGALVWYDAVWQPLPVRLGQAAETRREEIEAECISRGARSFRVFRDDLPDPRAQNVAILSEIVRQGILPGLRLDHVRSALGDLMEGGALDRNLGILAAG
ncbi:MAG TPA: 2-oxoacid:acceptor oxidoreductase family protein [Rectinemataceae bacterium]|nr:2-oxoacid:acceptor oxidoreductase family protein [Rectinemataceae bacterium]